MSGAARATLPAFPTLGSVPPISAAVSTIKQMICPIIATSAGNSCRSRQAASPRLAVLPDQRNTKDVVAV